MVCQILVNYLLQLVAQIAFVMKRLFNWSKCVDNQVFLCAIIDSTNATWSWSNGHKKVTAMNSKISQFSATCHAAVTRPGLIINRLSAWLKAHCLWSKRQIRKAATSFRGSCAGGERKNDARLSHQQGVFFSLACLMPNANHFWHRFLEASQKNLTKKNYFDAHTHWFLCPYNCKHLCECVIHARHCF